MVPAITVRDEMIAPAPVTERTDQPNPEPTPTDVPPPGVSRGMAATARPSGGRAAVVTTVVPPAR